MAFEVKFSKFDNTPWGFRLTGGSDYGMPLTVVKVSEGSLAETFGLKDNDIVSKINEKDTTSLTHDEAHEVILQAGNNFVATVIRNNQMEMVSCPMPVIDTTPLNNNMDQVPVYGAKVTSMVYKLYSDTETPLDNPQIPSPEHVDDIQIVNQQERKEISSKHIQSSCAINNTCVKSEEHKLIEQCAKEVIKKEDIEKATNAVELVNCQVNTSNETIQKKSITVDNKKMINTTEESKNLESKSIKKESISNSITETSHEVTLEEAKIGAVNAANYLMQHSKTRRSSIEATRLDTVNAFKTISQNMKHTCSAVPCESSNIQTKTQTDTLLKTFFIHLTDVMVALTQMISSDNETKICSCNCGANCNCMKQMSTTEEKSKLVKKEEKVDINSTEEKTSNQSKTDVVLKEVIDNIQSATGVDVTVNGKDPLEWLADLDQKQKTIITSENHSIKNVETESILVQSCMENVAIDAKCEQSIVKDTVVKQEEIQDKIIQSEMHEEIQTLNMVDSQEVVVQEIKQSEVKQSEIQETTQEIQQNVFQEVKQEIEQVQVEEVINDLNVAKEEPQPEKTAECKKDEETEVKPSWDIKVIPTVPQTPNTDEYVFRLNVKFKGKLSDYVEPIPVPKPPISVQPLAKPKKPKFTLGDIKIESNQYKCDDLVETQPNAETESASTNVPSPASANNVAFTNTISTNASKCNTNVSSSVSAASASNSTVSSATGNGAPATSSSIICTFPASDNGDRVTTTPAIINNHASLINCELHGREHAQVKADVIDVKQESIISAQENSMVIEKSDSMKITESNELTTGFNQTESMQVGHSIEQNVETNTVDEAATVEIAPQVQTMGESAKCFATIENGIQTLNDVGKPGLPDDEIKEILLGASREIKDQHVIGLQKVLASHMNRPDDEINTTEIKDIQPLVGFLRDSEVFKALNEESLKSKAEKLQEERRKYTTFLQKPNRPVPFCKRIAEMLTFEDPPYKVNIKKQPKKEKSDEPTSSILTEGVFLIPEVPILIPEPTPEYYEAPEYLADSSFPDLEDTGIILPKKPIEPIIEENPIETAEAEPEHKGENIEVVNNEQSVEIAEESCAAVINETIDETLSMEEQLARVQMQLVALSKLPATIQQTLDEVTKQLSKMVPSNAQEQKKCDVLANDDQIETSNTDENNNTEENPEVQVPGECEVETKIDENTLEVADDKITDESIEKQDDIKCDTVDLPVSDKEIDKAVTVDKDEKQNVELNENVKIEKLKKELIDELNGEHIMRQVKQRPGGRVGRPKPAFGPLVPQERPIVLPGGRKWKVPRDALTDSFIAETLSGQAEIIMGKTLGNHFENIYSPNVERVNFLKYNKPPKTLDHLKNSDVFKMIHDMDEPLHGIQERPPIVLAESEFREKCRSVTPNMFNGGISVQAE